MKRHLVFAVIEAWLIVELARRLQLDGWTWVDPAGMLAIVGLIHLAVYANAKGRGRRPRRPARSQPGIVARPSPAIRPASPARVSEVPSSRAPRVVVATAPADVGLAPPQVISKSVRPRDDRSCHRRQHAHIDHR